MTSTLATYNICRMPFSIASSARGPEKWTPQNVISMDRCGGHCSTAL